MRARTLSLLTASALAASCAGAAAVEPSNGACEHPAVADAPAAQTYATPDYSAQTDDVLEPDQAAAANAWRDYQQSVFDALRTSPDPRDWALAALARNLDFPAGDQGREAELANLLQRAVHVAPDDVLVQWIAVRQLPGDPRTAVDSLKALRLLEPDNAAVLIDVLRDAARRNDRAGVDRALEDMALATRFDSHYPDLYRAMVGAYQHQPIADAQWAAANPTTSPVSKEMAPFVSALAASSMAALPPFQDLVNACRISEATGEHMTRATNCAAIGRLMLAHGDTFIANRIGATVLRMSHTITDEDAHSVRDQDWIYQQFLAREADWNDERSTAEIAAHLRDQIGSGSEMETMRRTVARSGKALAPPADWVDPYSPLSPERPRPDRVVSMPAR